MSKPHKHAGVIKAWADGAEIEMRDDEKGPWVQLITVTPCWDLLEYRVKPERVYPATLMTAVQVKDVFNNYEATTNGRDWLEIANAAIRHAVDAKQVIPADEHKAEIADLHSKWVAQITEMNGKRAARDMAVAAAIIAQCKEELRKLSEGALIYCGPDNVDIPTVIAKVSS